MHPERDVLGFHLFRAEEQGPFQLASARIAAADDGAYTYLDTTRSLRGDRSYHYALRTVSTSHVESKFSDTVSVMPLTNRPAPLPPRDLGAQVDGEVAIVSWEDQSSDALWQAYAVLCSRSGAKVDTLWRNTNFLIDTLDATGQATSYRVLSMNVFGASSVPSPSVSVKARVALPSSPGGVQASAVAGKVLLTWQPPVSESVQRFDVYRYTRGSEPVKLGSVASNKPARFEDASPASGALNFYFVRSVAASGAESGASREVGVGM
jgi:fibronectin type 3 domain-containing protein